MTGSSLFQWSHERRLLQGNNDIWGDLSECPFQSVDGDGIEAKPYVEFFADDDPDRPILRILHRPPEGLSESHLWPYTALRVLVEKKNNNPDDHNYVQEEDQKEDDKRCILQ